MAKGAETITVGGASLGIGAVAGFTLDPDKGLEIIKWFNESMGPVGLMAVLGLGSGLAISVATNWLIWKRLKEKDIECQAELTRQRDSWKEVVEGKDKDNKEVAKTVSDLLVQVTLLVERARVASVQTRSS